MGELNRADRIHRNVQLVANVVVAVTGVASAWALFRATQYWRWFFAHPFDLALAVACIAAGCALAAWTLKLRRIGLDSANLTVLIWPSAIALLLIALVLELGFMPLRVPLASEADVTVNISGSTTLGEEFILQYILAVCRRNHATKVVTTSDVTNGIDIIVEADLSSVGDTAADRPDREFRGIKKIRFVIDSHGTEDGFQKLFSDYAQVAMASADMGTTRYKDRSREVESRPIAKDAIAIITSAKRQDPKKLRQQDLCRILGGQDPTFTTVFRADSGTTRDLLNYCNLKSLSGSSIEVKSNLEMLQRVSEDPKYIGYVSFAFLRYSANVRVIPIEEDDNQHTEAPTIDNILDDRCALIRDLYLYIKKTPADDSSSQVAELLYDLTTKPVGELVLRGVGFIPIADYNSHVERNIEVKGGKGGPKEEDTLPVDFDYEEAYAIIRRTDTQPLVTIPFTSNSNTLSEEARRKLVASEKSIEGNVIVFGHTDRHGGSAYNDGLSSYRAREISRALRGHVPVVGYFGLGQQYTLDSDESSRRVEVYSWGTVKRLLTRAANSPDGSSRVR